MSRLRRAALLAAFVMPAACGDGESSVATVDAGPGVEPRECAVTNDFGDVGVVPPELSVAVRRDDPYSGDLVSVTYIGALDDGDGEQDEVVIQLFRGFGVFATQAIEPGTYAITGEELNFATCGVCVRIFADRPLGVGKAVQDMMATGGTVTITELGLGSSGAFKARLNQTSFEHVTIDEQSFESVPVGDGCVSAIGHLEADVPMSFIAD